MAADLETLLPHMGDIVHFALPPARVSALGQTLGWAPDRLLPAMVAYIQRHARPRVSKFHVGSAVLTNTGAVQLGVNMELGSGCAIGDSVHAEQFGIAPVIQRGEHPVVIYVSHMPCGHCRQFMNELRNADALRIVVDGKSWLLPLLLPHSFKPTNVPGCYAIGDGPVLGEAGATAPLLRTGGGDTELVAAGVRAASQAHVPYTRRRAGVALRVAGGEVHVGTCIENAAYNPSLPPLQAALVALVCANWAVDFATITDVVLVQQAMPDGADCFDFEGTAQRIVSALSPRANFSAYTFL